MSVLELEYSRQAQFMSKLSWESRTNQSHQITGSWNWKNAVVPLPDREEDKWLTLCE